MGIPFPRCIETPWCNGRAPPHPKEDQPGRTRTRKRQGQYASYLEGFVVLKKKQNLKVFFGWLVGCLNFSSGFDNSVPNIAEWIIHSCGGCYDDSALNCASSITISLYLFIIIIILSLSWIEMSVSLLLGLGFFCWLVTLTKRESDFLWCFMGRSHLPKHKVHPTRFSVMFPI